MTQSDSDESQPQPPLAPEESTVVNRVVPVGEGDPEKTTQALGDAPSSEEAPGTKAPEVVSQAQSGDTLAPAKVSNEPADEDASKGKKRRRRRKKKQATAPDSADADAKPAATAPFARFFARGGSKKHAFAVGEVVAGRVERVADGVIVVDLFGKAKAILDVDEPREVPIFVPEPDAEAKAAPKFSREADTWPSHESDDEDSEVTSTGNVAAPSATADTVPGTTAAPPVSAVASTGQTAPSPPEESHAETEAALNEEVSAQATVEAGATSDTTKLEETVPPPNEDLSDADLALLEPLTEVEPPTEGGIFRGRIGSVSESGHIAIVNRDIDRAAVKKAIVAARAQKLRVQGVVYGYNRGGFDVLIGGIRAFCPASGMSLRPIDDPNEHVGKRVLFALPENKSGKRSIIVSRRNLLDKEARQQARARMEELSVGDKIDGKVIDIRDYGVLVDLGGGLDGLVHLSEVSWNRGKKASDLLARGDAVKVEVLKLQPASRKDRYGRVSLSIRTCLPDPWDEAADLLKPGNTVKGEVVRTTEFGAFVRIKDGIEGLLHISELGGKDITHAKQAIAEGAEIDVVVERVDKSQRRISLSKLSAADAKAIAEGGFDASKAPKSLKPGSHVNVVVKRVEHVGLRVQVEGVLGRRGRGFVPNRELGEGGGDQKKGPSQGSVIEVKIVGTDRDGSLRCSVKGMHLDDERKAVREYRKEAAKQGLGTFGDLLRAKLEQPADVGNE